MTAVQSVSSFLVPTPAWGANWAWGVPLIVLTVVIHVLGLGVIRKKAVLVSKSNFWHRYQTVLFAAVMGTITLLATVLHGIEAAVWAVAYRLLHALPDARSAMLYSLNAMTSYGHEALSLEAHWRLMGAMEALNGWLLFGVTTAFLFAMIDLFRMDRG